MITTFGEVMLRLSPKNSAERITQAIDFIVEPGGSESNVAIALSNLGLKSQFVSCLPESPLADKVIRQLKLHGVGTDYIRYDGKRIGVYWTETGIGPRNSYVVYDRADSAFCSYDYRLNNWDKILNDSKWLHFSGISPAVSEKVFLFLEELANFCSCPYSVDLNYRNKLWDWVDRDPIKVNQIMTKLCKKAILIAGNESDFQSIFGFKSNSDQEQAAYTEIAKRCFDKFNKAKYIAISNRDSLSATINNWSGYLFVKEDSNFLYKGISYPIDNIKDRVGTGDSFMAGIIYGILNCENMSYQQTVDFAVTLGALNHTTKGDASFFSANDVFNVLRSKGSGRILR